MHHKSYIKRSLLLSLSHLMLRNGKRYCYPSQEKLCVILHKYYGSDLGRRALNYHLAYLVDSGYIRRTRRIRRDVSGKLLFASTLYFFRKRGYSLLAKIANTGKKLEKFFRSTSADRKHALSVSLASPDRYNLPVPDLIPSG